MRLHIIASQDLHNNIGYDNDLIYNIPEDLRYFRKITTNKGGIPDSKWAMGYRNAVVMGRNSWDSIPERYRPLKNRLNVVVTSRGGIEETENIITSKSYEEAILFCESFVMNIYDVFVIGGHRLFESALLDSRLDLLYLTEIDYSIQDRKDVDQSKLVKIPNIDLVLLRKSVSRKACISVIGVEAEITYRYCIYRSNKHCLADSAPIWEDMGISTYRDAQYVNSPEGEYLELLRRALNGERREGRNGGTRSVFGVRMEFDVKHSVPLLTTKQMPWKTIIKELMWFVRGQTNNEVLREQGVRIWDGNSSRQFLDARGLKHYEEGDLGPIYGFQWRHFGAEYRGCTSDHTGEGVDQLSAVIKSIKNEPFSRRHVMSAWNPVDLEKMALPPCHLLTQFFVSKDNDSLHNLLSLQVYQRSGDAFLGIPFNLFSYTVLLYMVAHITGYKPGRLIHITGDFHVYEEHLDAVKEQLTRIPYAFPQLVVGTCDTSCASPAPESLYPSVRDDVTNIEDFTLADFKLYNYEKHPPIKASMVV
jgi:dihydrofolate reductase / thymidylate synthase